MASEANVAMSSLVAVDWDDGYECGFQSGIPILLRVRILNPSTPRETVLTTRTDELLKLGLAQGLFPQKVFKFRAPGDRTIDILKNCEMWFADPTTFNDPFDCRLSETHSHTRDDVEDYVNSQGLDGQEKAAILDLFDRDPAQVRDISVRARDGVIKKRGVLSLSKIHDNVLMWSHYAQNHEGLALGLDISKDTNFFSIPLKVDYQAQYTELNYFRDRADTIRRNLSTKAQCWKYEEELRVMKDTVGLISFDPACLIDIYFGCAASPVLVAEVRAACASGRLSHVRFHQGRVRHGEFALDFDPL